MDLLNWQTMVIELILAVIAAVLFANHFFKKEQKRQDKDKKELDESIFLLKNLVDETRIIINKQETQRKERLSIILSELKNNCFPINDCLMDIYEIIKIRYLLSRKDEENLKLFITDLKNFIQKISKTTETNSQWLNHQTLSIIRQLDGTYEEFIKQTSFEHKKVFHRILKVIMINLEEDLEINAKKELNISLNRLYASNSRE